jgi:uncharacterized membrane protein YphA (DoxX/SURF4 family)
MLPSASRYGAALAVLRMYTGINFLIHGYGKLTSSQWAVPGGECESIIKGMIEGTSGPYRDFITGVVLPHVSLFAHLVAWGETLTGIALFLGLLTQFAGVVGAFLTLNYWMAKGGFAHLDAYAGLDISLFALSAINAALPTGLVAGVDGLTAARKRPPSLGGKSAKVPTVP